MLVVMGMGTQSDSKSLFYVGSCSNVNNMNEAYGGMGVHSRQEENTHT